MDFGDAQPIVRNVELLQDANDLQRQAITADYRPVMIVAGPGTGKTKTLTARIAYLLARDVPAHSILGLTFTNKAAKEMRERVQALIGTDKVPTIATFHALCLTILKQERSGDVQFASDAERIQAVKQAVQSAGRKGLSMRDAQLAISVAKGSLEPNADDAALVQSYNTALHEQDLMDFDDIILEVYRLLNEDEVARRRISDIYQHILIDEFQDTSELQWQLVQLLRGSQSVFAIGDPKQSIYGFRGAGNDMFDVFRHDFPNRQDVVLKVNYRSTRSVVALATAIFGGDDALGAFSTDVGEVRALRTLNEYSEADLVLDTIERGIGGSNLQKATVESDGRRFRDFAILYRTHHASRALQKRLHDSGIPFQVVGEGSPYEQSDIRAIIDVLKWCVGGDLPRVKGFRPAQTQALLEGIDQAQPVSHIVAATAEAFGLNTDPGSRLRIEQFVSTLVRFDRQADGLAQCLIYIDRLSQTDFYDPEADAVTLLTIHAAKGLEFPHVVLIAAEEGILPNIRRASPTDFEEERRLFYVAVTRAKEKLDITYTKKRAGEVREPSRFMIDVNQTALPRVDDPNIIQLEKRLYKRQQKARQVTLF